MKYFVATGLALIAFVGITAAQDNGQTGLQKPVNGLVACWNFNEGNGSWAKEISNGLLNGSIHNAAWTKGVEGTALEFNGEDAYVNCSNHEVLNLREAMTIELWIKPEAWVAEDCGIVGKLSDDRNNGWSIHYNAYSNLLQFRVNINHTSEIISAATPLLNSWHHLAGTYDGHQVCFYIDGIRKGSVQVTGQIDTCADKLIIGKLLEHSPGFCFKGAIDEVKLYNYAIPESGIKTGFTNRGGVIKESIQTPSLRVTNYPKSFFISGSKVKWTESPDWFHTIRSFTWRGIPPDITLEQARITVKGFSELGINVVMPEGYRNIFAGEEDKTSYFNSPSIDEYIHNLKIVTQACHEYGIRMVGHLTACCVLETYYNEHPDQAMVDMKTGEKSYFRRYGTHMMCPNNPGFRKNFLDRVKRIVEETGMDGLMVDETEWLPAEWTNCGCPYCREKFKEKTGYDLPDPDSTRVWGNFDNPQWRAWINFRIGSMGDFLASVKEVLDQCGPGKLFMGCYCEALCPVVARFYGMDLEDMCRSFNTTFFECEPSNPWSWRYNMAEAKYYAAFGPCVYLGYSASYTQQFFSWAFAKTNGFGQWIWPEVQQIFPYLWEQKWEDLLKCHDILCNTAILFSSSTKNLMKKSYLPVYEYIGWAESLSEAHIPYETLIVSGLTLEKLKKYSRVILPDVACLSDAEINIFKEYVKEGGLLIATCETSMYNEKGDKRDDFGLGDLMGVTYKENVHLADSLSVSFPEITLSPGTEIGFKGDMISVVKRGTNPEITATMKASGLPALVLSHYGKGKVLYCAMRPGLNYYFPKVGGGRTGEGGAVMDTRIPEYKELMNKMATWGTSLPLYTANVPAEVVVNPFVYRNNGCKGITIHLLNCLGTRSDRIYRVPDNRNYEYLDYPSPKNFIPEGESMRIYVKGTGVRKAYFISPDFEEVVELSFKINNGYCEVTVPDLGRYGFIYLAQGIKDPVQEILKGKQPVKSFPAIEPFQISN